MNEFEFLPVTVHELVVGDDRTTVDTLTSPECDFCADSRVRWTYECGRVVLHDIGFGTDTPWAACDRCADLIDAGSRDELLARSVRSWSVRGHHLPPKAEEAVRQIQEAFFDHRESDRQAFG